MPQLYVGAFTGLKPNKSEFTEKKGGWGEREGIYTATIHSKHREL